MFNLFANTKSTELYLSFTYFLALLSTIGPRFDIFLANPIVCEEFHELDELFRIATVFLFNFLKQVILSVSSLFLLRYGFFLVLN